jgi:hypothetical protein
VLLAEEGGAILGFVLDPWPEVIDPKAENK